MVNLLSVIDNPGKEFIWTPSKRRYKFFDDRLWEFDEENNVWKEISTILDFNLRDYFEEYKPVDEYEIGGYIRLDMPKLETTEEFSIYIQDYQYVFKKKNIKNMIRLINDLFYGASVTFTDECSDYIYISTYGFNVNYYQIDTSDLDQNLIVSDTEMTKIIDILSRYI